MKLTRYSSALILVCLVMFTVLVLLFNLYMSLLGDFSGYTELARSLINKRLDLTHISIQEDYATYDSKYYLHQGPFPAVLLIPFVFVSDLIKIQFQQSFLHFFVFLGTLFICFKIARLFKYGDEDSFYFAYAFCLSSVYQSVSIIPISPYLSQVVSVFFTLLAIYEFLVKRRYFLVGLYSSFALTTRSISGLVIIFFIIEILTNKRYEFRKRVLSLFKLLFPYTLAIISLMLYNQIRFMNPFDSGYMKVTTLPLISSLFSLSYIPMNFYYYFVNTFKIHFESSRDLMLSKIFSIVPNIKVVEPGTSFFIVSPFFLNVFRANFKKRIVGISLVPIFTILIVLLAYYSPGWVQVGPRYMIDVLPFIFILLLHSFKSRRLSLKAKFLILFSSIFNFYLFLTIFL